MHFATCRPLSCPRHCPGHLATMAAPSPWGSRLVGDPVFTFVRRSVRLVPHFVPLPRSLPGVHLRERSAIPGKDGVYPCVINHHTYSGDIASGMLRWVLGFTTGDLGSTNAGLAMRTGLAVPHDTYLLV